ncbi:MAG: TRAP transporter substrate-binding protein [Myxococcaceae bacterium]|nr:TRAP transporter substrate-binding protein [Myxococcaceae bacterium]
MKRLSLLVVCSLVLAVPAFAQDAKVVLKVGSVAPEGTPWSEWLDGVKARLEKDSGNRIKLKLFLGGKLGGEKEMAEETRNGNLAMFGGSAGALATYVPELAGIELPYLYSSDAEADFVLDKIRPQVAKLLEAKGFTMVMWGENGWHGYGIKGKCVEKPDDMKGLKMRSQESFVHMETYKAFGAAPVEMSVPEVLGALQTGTVDGYSNSPLLSQATSWYKGVTHYTYTKHIYQPALIVISKKVFDAQPDDLKTILLNRSDERSGITGVRALTEPLLDNFTAAKKTVCKLTPEQAKAFEAKARPVWDVFAKKSASNKALLDAMLAAKKEFAAGKK